jgi:hypothetical protein
VVWETIDRNYTNYGPVPSDRLGCCLAATMETPPGKPAGVCRTAEPPLVPMDCAGVSDLAGKISCGGKPACAVVPKRFSGKRGEDIGQLSLERPREIGDV